MVQALLAENKPSNQNGSENRKRLCRESSVETEGEVLRIRDPLAVFAADWTRFFSFVFYQYTGYNDINTVSLHQVIRHISLPKPAETFRPTEVSEFRGDVSKFQIKKVLGGHINVLGFGEKNGTKSI